MQERNPPMKGRAEWLFRELNNAHRMATDAVTSRLGLRELGQPIILFILEDCGDEGISQGELAKIMRVSPATVTVSLKSLERHACIRKVPDETDMRRNRIEITEKGRHAARLCRLAHDRIDRAMYRGFSREEMDTISSLYVRMTENLFALARDPGPEFEGREPLD